MQTENIELLSEIQQYGRSKSVKILYNSKGYETQPVGKLKNKHAPEVYCF